MSNNDLLNIGINSYNIDDAVDEASEHLAVTYPGHIGLPNKYHS